MAGKECPHAGSFSSDAGEGAGIGHGVRPPAAQLHRHRHRQELIFARQGDDLVVVSVLDVTELLDRPQLFTEGVDIVQQRLLIRGVHPMIPLVGE